MVSISLIFLCLSITFFCLASLFSFYLYRAFARNITRFLFSSITLFSIYGLIFIVSFLQKINLSLGDVTFFFAIFFFFQSCSFICLFYTYSQKKLIFGLLGLYVVPLFSAYSIFNSISLISIFILFILSLFFYAERFISLFDAIFGIIYSGGIIIFYLLYSQFFNELVALFIAVLFLVTSYLFLSSLIKLPVIISKIEAQDNYLRLFLHYFLFILTITLLCLISSVVIHELGHVLYAKFSNCTYRTILFDNSFSPHTEILCQDNSILIKALLAGPILPLIIAIILFIFGGFFIKEISLLLVGFDILASFKDFQDALFSPAIILFSTFMGICFLIFGVVLLSRTRFESALTVSVKSSKVIH